MAGNQAMLDYLQREAGYSRAGLSLEGLGPVRRRARVGDRVVRAAHQPGQRPAAACAQRDLEPGAARGPAGVPAGGPAGLAHAGRRGAVCGQARRRARSPSGPWPNTSPTGSACGRSRGRTGTAGRSRASPRRCGTSSPRGGAPSGRGVRQLIEEYERRHGKAPNARAVWSMAQFVTLDSRRAKAHSAPTREALLAQWEAQSRRAETEALSAIPDAVLGRRDAGRAARPPSGAELRPDPGRRGRGRAAAQGDVLPVRADPDDQPVPARLPRRPVRASR